MTTFPHELKTGTPYLDNERKLLYEVGTFIASADNIDEVQPALHKLLFAIVRLTNKCQALDDYAHGIRIDF